MTNTRCDFGSYGEQPCQESAVVVFDSSTRRRPMCLRHGVEVASSFGYQLRGFAPGWAVESDGTDWYVTDPSGALVAAS